MPVSSFAEADGVILMTYADAAAAFTALDKFEMYQAVATATVHPAKVSQFLELCYAHRDSLPRNVLEAAADIGAFAATMGFYGLGQDGRGARMVAVLRGEDVADPPVPADRYVRRPPSPPTVMTEGNSDAVS